MMTAAMAANDTNQLPLHNKNNNITTPIPIYSMQQQQYNQQISVGTTILTAPTTIQTAMGRTINIGIAGYTHTYIHKHQSVEDEINVRVKSDEVANIDGIVAASTVDIDDDAGNAIGNGKAGVDSDAAVPFNAATVTVGNANIAVDARTFDQLNDIVVDDDDDDDESDSLGSLETLSDNVAIWVDGEKHWVAGVDANTTCADLIGALLNYQNAQQQLLQQKHQQQQYICNASHTKNNNHYSQHTNNNNSNTTTTTTTNNTVINQSAATIKASTTTTKETTVLNTKEDCDPLLAATGELTVGGCFSAAAAAPASALTVPATGNGVTLCGNQLAHAFEYVIVRQHRHCEEYLDGNAKVFDVLPTHEAASRKECELLLRRLTANNKTSTSHSSTFTPSPLIYRPGSPSLNLNTQVSSLLSTDKDSGMGSPVGSSRSARLRRRKYKSAATVSWLAQANTLHPRVSQRAVAAFSGLGNTLATAQNHDTGGGNSKHNFGNSQAFGEDVGGATAVGWHNLGFGGGGVSANERLLKIILAQDETIHRQLALLREKERQISKIEVEKHRVRERELGKNYLLETYLNGLEEAAVEPDLEACTYPLVDEGSPHDINDTPDANDDGDGDGDGEVEIFVDEPYLRPTGATMATPNNDITRNNAREFSIDARHSKKMKEDSSGDCGIGVANEHGHNNAIADNEKEVDLQLLWLEEIYALNKQLQREEELLLRLHAKIRKHQVKRAYQTKREVLQQIEKLDSELTLQCCDIRAVESRLHTSNVQLKQKLSILERLSQEFVDTMETTVATQATVVTEASSAGADVRTTANKVSDVINGDGRHDATVRHATGVTIETALQVMDDHPFHVKQMTHPLVEQQDCQLKLMPQQRQISENQLETSMPHAKMNLPYAAQQATHLIATNLNNISDSGRLHWFTNTTTTPIIPATSITITNRTTPIVYGCNSPTISSALTDTICTASNTTRERLTTTATTTNSTDTITATASACNMPTIMPMATKHKTAFHHPQHQQQLPQEQHSYQYVDIDGVLVATVETVGEVILPHSNYPISCINHAAIQATSQLSTKHVGASDTNVIVDAATTLTTPEQTLLTATSVLSAAASTVANSNSMQQQQQQQPQQAMPQRQHVNISSCNTNRTSDYDKNLLPPLDAANTKTMQKQMFKTKSLNQMMPIAESVVVAAATSTIPIGMPASILMTAPASSTSVLEPLEADMRVISNEQSHNTNFSAATIPAPLRPTTPTALLITPPIPAAATSPHLGMDITQLGTLV